MENITTQNGTNAILGYSPVKLTKLYGQLRAEFVIPCVNSQLLLQHFQNLSLLPSSTTKALPLCSYNFPSCLANPSPISPTQVNLPPACSSSQSSEAHEFAVLVSLLHKVCASHFSSFTCFVYLDCEIFGAETASYYVSVQHLK